MINGRVHNISIWLPSNLLDEYNDVSLMVLFKEP